MFSGNSVFNKDISKWDVSRVTNMNHMFAGAASFHQQLRGAAWVRSSATKKLMFGGSPGSIMFSPQSKTELIRAVDACMRSIAEEDCSSNIHGPIGEWDMSNITELSSMFLDEVLFDEDISKWDVSRVSDMSAMFKGAKEYNGDVSTWDVSSVTDMAGMFSFTDVFNSNISTWDCLLYTSPSPRDRQKSRMPSSA